MIDLEIFNINANDRHDGCYYPTVSFSLNEHEKGQEDNKSSWSCDFARIPLIRISAQIKLMRDTVALKSDHFRSCQLTSFWS